MSEIVGARAGSLMMRHSRRAQAHRMLSKIYNWFTEGFDTDDLKEAKAMLE